MKPAADRSGTDKPVVLVTGIAGFIGFHFASRLLAEGHPVVGIDNLNDYYDVELKIRPPAPARFFGGEDDGLPARAKARLDRAGAGVLQGRPAGPGKGWPTFSPMKSRSWSCTWPPRPACVTRWRTPGPTWTATSLGFMNILENCRRHPVRHLVYASSSSVYGGNQTQPFSVRHNVDHPLSLYAASKKANELMAHSYSHLFAIPATGLRFFTVYGPWGRPDMALFIFTRKILRGEAIEVYNFGNMKRDFTYIDDIVEGMWRVLNKAP